MFLSTSVSLAVLWPGSCDSCFCPDEEEERWTEICVVQNSENLSAHREASQLQLCPQYGLEEVTRREERRKRMRIEWAICSVITSPVSEERQLPAVDSYDLCSVTQTKPWTGCDSENKASGKMKDVCDSWFDVPLNWMIKCFTECCTQCVWCSASENFFK